MQYCLPTGWTQVSWTHYQSLIEKVAAGLLSLGVKPGDRVALMSNTRFEWGCTDLACLLVGAIVVPIYQNNVAEDVEYVLNDCEAKVLISEDRKTLRIWRKIAARCSHIRHVAAFETDSPGDPTLLTWEGLIHSGEEYLRHQPEAVRTLAARPTLDDAATILYTSGTTGRPKGVLLTHRQIISEINDAFTACNVTPHDRSLAMLPFAHVMGRIEFWGHVWVGFTLSYAESLERVRDNLKHIQPTVLISVPRIFEKIYAGVLSQIEGSVLKKELFTWAMDVSEQVRTLEKTRQHVPLLLIGKNVLAHRLVFDRIKQAFGGQLRFAISGGAPLNPEIARFFETCGILVLEGYGLTETTAAVCLNLPHNYAFGSVGLPLPDVQIKIADDGEVLVKSDKVMKEYYKNPEATAEAIKDGWFHTGDVGVILPNGHLKITDRKKDLIKTAGGKYVAPQKIENLLKINPLIAHVVVVGDQQKFISAMIAVERPEVEKLAREKGWQFTRWTELLDRPEIVTAIRDEVAQANAQLASWETIKRYVILPEELTVEGGDITTSLKVKRKHLTQKFSHLL